MIYIENTELYHHGVKGQKWGVIRKRLQSSVSRGGHSIARQAIRGKNYISRTLAKKRAKRKEIKETVHLTKMKDTAKMSDSELRIATARLQLENNYIKAYKERYPVRQSKIEKFINGSMEKMGRAGISKLEYYVTKDIPGYQPYIPDSWKNDDNKKKKKKKG